MKLVIQIPCYNEEETLPITFKDLPREIEGIDEIRTLVIDDGSTDRTIDVAKKIGVDHIISFNRHKGLSRAFAAGIEKSLELGAGVIVNTDADNQYCGKDIERLVRPIIEGRADVVIGDRETDKIQHFSWIKRRLQKFGSKVVRRLSNTAVPDAVSGFRAYSREAAMRINILTEFSYTIENLIQLGNQKISIISVPVRVNKTIRESRLFRGMPTFVTHQIATVLRVYATYKALKAFSVVALVIIIPGIIGFVRFLYYYFTSGGQGHIQSLIFSAVLLNVGFLIFVFGVIADLVSNNRKLIEKVLYMIKKLELEGKENED